MTSFDPYVRGDIAVCILEVGDLDVYIETTVGDKAVEEWERRVVQFKREGVDISAPKGGQILFIKRYRRIPRA